MCDLGFTKKLVLATDAKATEHILHTQAIGRVKHVDVAHSFLGIRRLVAGLDDPDSDEWTTDPQLHFEMDDTEPIALKTMELAL